MQKIVKIMGFMMLSIFIWTGVVDAANYDYTGIDRHPSINMTDNFIANNVDKYIYQINFETTQTSIDETYAVISAHNIPTVFDINVLPDPEQSYIILDFNSMVRTVNVGKKPLNTARLISQITLNVPDVPDVPASPSVTVINGNQEVTLSWQPVPDAASYNVYRDGILIDTTTTTSYTDTDVINGQSYTYTITAVNVAGESLPSNPVTGQPFEPIPPDAPTGLQVNNGNGQVILSWQPVPDAASYNVYRDGILIDTTTTTSYTDTGLTNGQSYTYTITAVNADGESLPSVPITGAPFANVPASPSVTVTNGNQEVTLQWQPVPNATSYNVYRDGILIYTTTTTSYTDTGLTNGQSYTYTITAVNDQGESLPATATGRPSDLPSFGGINLGFGIGDMLRTATGFLGLYNVWVLLVAGVLFVPVLVWFIFWVIGKTRRKHVGQYRSKEDKVTTQVMDRGLGRRSGRDTGAVAQPIKQTTNIKPITDRVTDRTNRDDRPGRSGRMDTRMSSRTDRIAREGRITREGRTGRI